MTIGHAADMALKKDVLDWVFLVNLFRMTWVRKVPLQQNDPEFQQLPCDIRTSNGI